MVIVNARFEVRTVSTLCHSLRPFSLNEGRKADTAQLCVNVSSVFDHIYINYASHLISSLISFVFNIRPNKYLSETNRTRDWDLGTEDSANYHSWNTNHVYSTT